MTSNTTPAVEARGLRKSFRGSLRVDDVTFTVDPGRVAGLLGPNGAGKTTTIRLILGLAAPDSGAAYLEGRPFAELDSPTSTVGAVLDAGGLHPGRTARQHLRIAAARARLGDDRVDAVLAEVDLSRDADRRIAGYSLGMRQRVALAAALIARPRILVLDEPANGLDPAGTHWLRGMLRSFADAGGAVLLSSHLLADVQSIADDIVVLANGRVAAARTLDAALAESDGRLEDYYLRLTTTTGVR